METVLRYFFGFQKKHRGNYVTGKSLEKKPKQGIKMEACKF